MKGIKQEAGSSDCSAVVAAMACETSVEDFKKFFGSDGGPYSELHVHLYCLFHNRIVGVGGSLYDGHVEGSEYACMIVMPLENQPCILCVDSETIEGMMHMMYWDGVQIWDPNSKSEDGRELSSYKIQRIFPVTKLEDPVFKVPVDSRRFLIRIFEDANFMEK